MDKIKSIGGAILNDITGIPFLKNEAEKTNRESVENLPINVRTTQKEIANKQEEIDLFKENFEKLKKIFRGEAEFKIDKDTNMVVIKIKDPDTGEIIRQIPPELAVKLAKNIQEILGVLMDERV
ncbi:flagellar protein FlaG [Fervidobacterium nodosum]|uniref:Flagellar protein FlaG protein n=1 Tax=Fervidobacterium nodosum (strain ATCC 35602 / DSM 5306 / Rt17-B1) TaxID=381764 RepID=A7HK33_FERNB|nr:flagellar protein FlaG [Fervidobacterium nodosum]ABS60266.1 flagellar protein FlaG protein [Fervidobacterium nodosum Rt17-B1]